MKSGEPVKRGQKPHEAATMLGGTDLLHKPCLQAPVQEIKWICWKVKQGSVKELQWYS